MKAFKIILDEDIIIVAARNPIEALEFYRQNSMAEVYNDLQENDSIEEIPQNKWNQYVIKNTDFDEEDPTEKMEFTLTEMMKNISSPEIISVPYE